MKRHLAENSETLSSDEKRKKTEKENSLIDQAMAGDSLLLDESVSSQATIINNIECPKEILSLIIDFQDVDSLQQTKLVCKNFYELSVLDKHYEKVMTKEFPIYSERLKHLNEFNHLMVKLFKRRYVSNRIERLFWWIVEKSQGNEDEVEKIIVNSGLVDLMEKIESQFNKLMGKLTTIGRENGMTDYEDDGGMYAVCKIISQGEEYFNRICANPKEGADSPGHEDYMYPFNLRTYIPEEGDSDLDEQTIIKALSEGYEAFKELDL